MTHYLQLMRVGQWYKNLVLVLPFIIFERELVLPLGQLLLAFFGFCAISSVTYVMNDWIDRKADRLHPMKKNGPLASGKVRGKQAIVTALLLAVFVTFVMMQLGIFYATVVGIYVVMTIFYSLGLKHVPVLDVVMISGNFVLRTLAGMSVLPNVEILPYFTFIFFLHIILLTHKRRGDFKLIGKKAFKHKPVIRFYTPVVSWMIRGVGYAAVIASLYFLRGLESDLFLILLLAWLVMSSLIFSERPELTRKPKLLFTLWYWDMLLIFIMTLLLAAKFYK